MVMKYVAYDRLLHPARASGGWARFCIGLLVFVVLGLVLNTSLAVGMADGLSRLGLLPRGVNELAEGRSPLTLILLLFTFLGYIFALMAVLWLFHRRSSLLGLIGSLPVALRQGGRVFFYSALLFALVSLVPSDPDYPLQPNIPLGSWLVLLAPLLIGLFVQVSAEELVFRGYFQSQLAARGAPTLVWLILPSICFGFLHHQPDLMGPNAWLITAWSALFGLAAADLTARAGTLGPAIAMHLINNLYAIGIVSQADYLDGAALFVVARPLDDPTLIWDWVPQEILVTFCLWLVARLALRR